MKPAMVHPASWADVLSAISEMPLSKATRKDYRSALGRGVELMGVNRLADIPADLTAFHRRFGYDAFDPVAFASEKAYRAWRRKVAACLKHYFGILENERIQRAAPDGWAAVLVTAEALVEATDGMGDVHLIALHNLVREARRRGWAPQEVTTQRIHLIALDLENGARQSIVKAARTLDFLRADCKKMDSLLYPEPYLLDSVRPGAVAEHADALMAEARDWINAYCSGEQDEILGTFENARAASTFGCYNAAFRKYLTTLERLGLLDGADSLKSVLGREAFNAVMRHWIENADQPGRISRRTMHQYVTAIRRIAKVNAVDVAVMEKALRLNRDLRQGKRENGEMGQDARRFCAWLLGDRHAEMLYRSLHVRFYELCQALLAAEREGRLRDVDRPKIVQFGSLAALAAIEVWGPPLRIDNVRSLTIAGEKPSLLFTKGRQTHAAFRIPGAQTKTGKEINQKLVPSRNRAFEILVWYLEEIRPRCCVAAASIYLFPGRGEARKPISASALRSWLDVHGRRVGIRMKPHWFRHAVASLYIRDHPEGFTHIAKLLDDTPESVRIYYAWVNDVAVLDEVQREILSLAGFDRGKQ